MAACFVYIVTNRPCGALYCGMTNDLAKRAWEHRTGVYPGFTRKYNCTRLVWYEAHDDFSAAAQREYLLKRWRRAWKIRLIEDMNPGWLDLGLDLTA
ncbi:MAG: GIY-YIG nuclease family protein [Oceanicaulis sp.]